MNIKEFFTEHNRTALAFSGGVDSSYLLYAGIESGADVCAYYVRTEFQPQFEYDDAMRMAEMLGARIKVIELSVLDCPEISANDAKRCYYCKKRIFSAICNAAACDGYSEILDGTNASDDISDRPGFASLQELSVLSPLRDCGLTKDEIRKLSRDAGLFTWNKPAYACLATRTAVYEKLTAEKLKKTEEAEEVLSGLGFVDFRVRNSDGNARLEIRKEQFGLLFDNVGQIMEKLKPLYKTISLDLEGRK